MKISEKAPFILIIVLLVTVAAFGLLGYFYVKKTDQFVEVQTQYERVTDTVKITRNALNQSVSKVSLLEGEKTKNFLTLKTKDQTIKRLQEAVKLNQSRISTKGSVVVFDSQTLATTTVKTIVTPGEQVIKSATKLSNPDTIKVYPKYSSKFDLGGWVVGSVEAERDSTKIGVGVLNKYTVVLGQDVVKKGFLGIGKKTETFSEVTNLNPYSTVPVLRAYSTVDKRPVKKLFSFGPQAGVNLQGKTYVGVGAQINLLNLF